MKNSNYKFLVTEITHNNSIYTHVYEKENELQMFRNNWKAEHQLKSRLRIEIVTEDGRFIEYFSEKSLEF